MNAAFSRPAPFVLKMVLCMITVDMVFAKAIETTLETSDRNEVVRDLS